MLILGIDTATRRVGVALASRARAARRASSSAARSARAPRHAEQLAPAIDVPVRAGRRRPRPPVGDRGRHRARAVHRAARRRDHRQGDGPGAAHPGGRDPEPRPRRVPAAPQPAARRRRRSTRAATRCSSRCYRPVPGGVQRVVRLRGRHARRARRPSSRRAARRRCCAATASRASRRRSPTLDHAELAGHRARGAEPRRARRARDRRATSARSSPRRPSVRPLYLRQSDAEIAWDAQERVTWPRCASRSSRSTVHIVPMRRRHLRSVLRIEQQVYPRPWRTSLFLSRARAAVDARVLRRAGRPRRRRVRGPDDVARRRRTSRRSRSTRRGTGTTIGTRLLLALAREAIARGATALTLEVRLSNKPRAGDVPPLRVRAGRRAQGLLPGDQRGRARDVGARGRHARRTRELLDGDRAARARARPSYERPKSLVTRILGIETSCDETAAAVVDDGRVVRSSVVSSQVDLHARFGGVVPEVASRAHVELDRRRDRGGARRGGRRARATSTRSPRATGPGLAGALLVGVSAAKALALAADLPYVGVNHLEAHLYAALARGARPRAAARRC